MIFEVAEQPMVGHFSLMLQCFCTAFSYGLFANLSWAPERHIFMLLVDVNLLKAKSRLGRLKYRLELPNEACIARIRGSLFIPSHPLALASQRRKRNMNNFDKGAQLANNSVT